MEIVPPRILLGQAMAVGPRYFAPMRPPLGARETGKRVGSASHAYPHALMFTYVCIYMQYMYIHIYVADGVPNPITISELTRKLGRSRLFLLAFHKSIDNRQDGACRSTKEPIETGLFSSDVRNGTSGVRSKFDVRRLFGSRIWSARLKCSIFCPSLHRSRLSRGISVILVVGRAAVLLTVTNKRHHRSTRPM